VCYRSTKQIFATLSNMYSKFSCEFGFEVSKKCLLICLHHNGVKKSSEFDADFETVEKNVNKCSVISY
jgi:hypothetical protein